MAVLLEQGFLCWLTSKSQKIQLMLLSTVSWGSLGSDISGRGLGYKCINRARLLQIDYGYL